MQTLQKYTLQCCVHELHLWWGINSKDEYDNTPRRKYKYTLDNEKSSMHIFRLVQTCNSDNE